MSASAIAPTPGTRIVLPPRGTALLVLRLLVEGVLAAAALLCAAPLATMRAYVHARRALRRALHGAPWRAARRPTRGAAREGIESLLTTLERTVPPARPTRTA